MKEEKNAQTPKEGCRHWTIRNVPDKTIRAIRAMAELEGKNTSEVLDMLLCSHRLMKSVMR